MTAFNPDGGPEGFAEPTPLNLARWWWERLNRGAFGVPADWRMEMGLRPAKELLKFYPYKVVADEVWRISRDWPHPYSLWFVLRRLDGKGFEYA